MVYVNFKSLLNGVGGVGSVGAWVRGWRETNFGIDCMGRVGTQSLARIKKYGRSQNFGVG